MYYPDLDPGFIGRWWLGKTSLLLSPYSAYGKCAVYFQPKLCIASLDDALRQQDSGQNAVIINRFSTSNEECSKLQACSNA